MVLAEQLVLVKPTLNQKINSLKKRVHRNNVRAVEDRSEAPMADRREEESRSLAVTESPKEVRIRKVPRWKDHYHVSINLNLKIIFVPIRSLVRG